MSDDVAVAKELRVLDDEDILDRLAGVSGGVVVWWCGGVDAGRSTTLASSTEDGHDRVVSSTDHTLTY